MKSVAFLILLFISDVAQACPACAGSVDSPKNNIVWVLITFIALTYIPFYFIYKTIIKNRHVQLNISSEKK